MKKEKGLIQTDGWFALQQFTAARIALGRTGVSIPVKEMLQFKMAHAHARDAVFSTMNTKQLVNELQPLQLPVVTLKSKATDRHIYLQRPDWGRRLSEDSVELLSAFSNKEYDVCISIADGLSAEAINHHAVPIVTELIKCLLPLSLRIAPVCLIMEGRVAISDEIGSLLHSKLSLILIGERPGLSSPDSMGAYLTYAPQIGLTDEKRNCVSNIRPEGLRYEEATEKLLYLITESMRLQLSGVGLKDNRNLITYQP